MIVPEIGLKNENLKNDSEKIDIYIYIYNIHILTSAYFFQYKKQTE